MYVFLFQLVLQKYDKYEALGRERARKDKEEKEEAERRRCVFINDTN